MTAAMVALVLDTTFSVQSARFDFWDMITEWTSEIFHFNVDYFKTENPVQERNDEFASLKDAMEKQKIPLDLIPT